MRLRALIRVQRPACICLPIRLALWSTLPYTTLLWHRSTRSSPAGLGYDVLILAVYLSFTYCITESAISSAVRFLSRLASFTSNGLSTFPE